MNELFDPPAIIKSIDALSELASCINAEHQQAEQHLQAGLQHAKNAGDLLIEAKKRCKHGEWLPWLKANVKPSPRTVQAYMRVAKRWGDLETRAKAQGLAHLTLESGLKLLAKESTSQEIPALIETFKAATVSFNEARTALEAGEADPDMTPTYKVLLEAAEALPELAKDPDITIEELELLIKTTHDTANAMIHRRLRLISEWSKLDRAAREDRHVAS
jgi:hypothetical protein